MLAVGAGARCQRGRVFAVRTTGVFLPPFCRSGSGRVAAKCSLLLNAQQALDAGFRPASAVSRIMRARSNGGWIRLPAPRRLLEQGDAGNGVSGAGGGDGVRFICTGLFKSEHE